MSGVFLSHVSPGIDSAIARRVHRDLERSGFTVWRFERMANAHPAICDDVAQRIDRCDAFILLDSSRARQSTHVRDECRRISDRRVEYPASPRLIVCSIEPPGPRRNENPLIDGLPRARSIDLLPEHYHRGLFDLCRALGAAYVSNFARPRDADFVEELGVAHLTAADAERLREAYERFRTAADAGHVADAEAAAKMLCPRLMQLDRPLVTPLLAIGSFYYELGDDATAERAFTEAVRIAPSDPRGWSGLAAARASRGAYQPSFDAYKVAVRLLRGTSNPKHQQGRAQISIEAAAVAAALNDSATAIELLDAAERVQPATAAVLALRGRVLRRAGVLHAAYDTLEAALVASSYMVGMSVDVSLELAECCVQLGDFERAEEVLVRALKQDDASSRIERRLCAVRATMCAR